VVLLLAWLVLVPRLTPTQEEAPTVEPTPEPITVNGSVVPVERARLGFSQPGQITNLPVSVGQPVRKGEVLAEVTDRDLRRQIADAEAALAVQQAALNRVEAGPRAEELRAADAQVDSTQARLDLLLAGSTDADVTSARRPVPRSAAHGLHSTSW
jgi:multidrug efflux pump subunit AcrA (membrane-fusion protein)